MYRYRRFIAPLLAVLLLLVPLTGCDFIQDHFSITDSSSAAATTAPTSTPASSSPSSSAGQTASTDVSSSASAAPQLSVPDDGRTYSMGRSVTSAKVPPYYEMLETYTENTQDQEFTQNGCAYTISMPVFDFLKNVEINEKVANRIQQEAEALSSADPPKMSGGARFIENTPTESNTYVSFPSGGIINDVLSVNVARWVSYGQDDYYYEMHYINLDMNTGDDIPLSAVFTDGYDYVAAINAYLLSYIEKYDLANDDDSNFSSEYDMFYLIAPFKGIREDQQFCITSNGIILLLDFENKEFEIPNGPSAEIFISYETFGEHVAIFDRYLSENDLYTDDPQLVLPIEYLDNTQTPLEVSTENVFSFSGAQLSFDNVPDMVLPVLQSYVVNSYPPLPAFKTMAEDEVARRKNDDNGTPSLWSEASLERYGNFYTLHCYTNVYGFSLYDNYYLTNVYCYNAAMNRTAELSDFFLQGVDIKAILKPLLEKEAANYSATLTFDEDLNVRDGDLEGSIVYSPGPYGLSVTIQWYKDGSRCYDPESTQLFVNYRDIGYESLIFFQ